MNSLEFTLLMHLARGAIATTAAVLLLTLLARKFRIETPRVLRWAYAGALMLPLLSPLAGIPLHIPVFQTQQVEAPPAAPAAPLAYEVTPGGAPAATHVAPPVTDPAPLPVEPATASNWKRADVSALLIACAALVWLAGVLWLCVSGVASYCLFLRRLQADRIHASDSLCHHRWKSQWRSLLVRAGVQRRIPLLITRRTGPCLARTPAGYVLAVPERLWEECNAPQRAAILLHELSHFTRGDLWKHAALRLLVYLQWFNPAAWSAIRRFEQCGEWLSDSEAASTNFDRIQLAHALTHVATQVAAHPQRNGYSLAAGAAGHPLAQRIERLLGSPVYEVSTMKKFLMIAGVALVAATQMVRLELSAEEQAPNTVEGVKAAVEDLTAEAEKLKTAVEGVRTRGEALKKKVEMRVQELKATGANPQQASKEGRAAYEQMKTGDKAKQLEALKKVASLGDEGLILAAYAAKSSPHDEVRQAALTQAASLKEKGLPVLAFSFDSLTQKDKMHLAREIEKNQMPDRLLLYKALMKDASGELQDAVLAAGAKLDQRALFIASIAEAADAALLAKIVSHAAEFKGRDGQLLMFAAAGSDKADLAIAAVEAAGKRGAAGLPVLAAAAGKKDVKVRYAVVKSAATIGGEAGDYIVDRCLQASDGQLRSAAESAVKDSKKK